MEPKRASSPNSSKQDKDEPPATNAQQVGTTKPRPIPGGAVGYGWAWEELNLRPHAYQACALTT